jgi:hypothetical protein
VSGPPAGRNGGRIAGKALVGSRRPADYGKEDNVDRQDLRTVLRLFAEIASSMKREESAVTSDLSDTGQGGESRLPEQGNESWASSAAQ